MNEYIKAKENINTQKVGKLTSMIFLFEKNRELIQNLKIKLKGIYAIFLKR